ncbi:MAG: hypothetical protein HYZ24_17690, partial [Chloroflexi bacterium]|nr:hypothetical protein [Chloroflexota bacterium]
PGGRVVTTDQKGIIYIWDVESGQKLSSLNGGMGVISMTVSPDGKYLVTGTEEGNRSIVWDLATLTKITELEQIGLINSVQFSKDGKILATGSSETSVYLWNAGDGSFSRIGHEILVNGNVITMSFSPDDKLLAVGDSAHYVYLFDIASNGEINRLPHADKVTSVSFSPDGKQLVSVSRKTVLLWDLPSLPSITSENLIDAACSHLISNFDDAKLKFFFEGAEDEHRNICPNLPAGN